MFNCAKVSEALENRIGTLAQGPCGYVEDGNERLERLLVALSRIRKQLPHGRCGCFLQYFLTQQQNMSLTRIAFQELGSL